MQHVKARQCFRAVGISQQHAEGLRFAAPYAPAQLVQLGQAETVGVFDYHQRGIWHVNANFYNRSADKCFYFTGSKIFHHRFFFGRLHFAMQQCTGYIL